MAKWFGLPPPFSNPRARLMWSFSPSIHKFAILSLEAGLTISLRLVNILRCTKPPPKFYESCFLSFKVDLIHINSIPGNDTVSYGMDLSEYYLNVEWDILSVPSERHVKSYPCCPEQYPGKITQPISKELSMEQKVEFLTQCEILTLMMYLLCITMHCCSILHCPTGCTRLIGTPCITSTALEVRRLPALFMVILESE